MAIRAPDGANKRRHLVNCQKSGLDTVGSSISIVDLLRNDDASIDDWSSILRSSIYRVFENTRWICFKSSIIKADKEY